MSNENKGTAPRERRTNIERGKENAQKGITYKVKSSQGWSVVGIRKKRPKTDG